MLKRDKAPASAATPAEAKDDFVDRTNNPHRQYITSLFGNASALLRRVNSRPLGNGGMLNG